MEGPAIARWVRRHDAVARFMAALELADEGTAVVLDRLRRENPRAGAREIREFAEGKARGR